MEVRQILSDIGMLAGIGAALDTVFVGQSERERIRTLLDQIALRKTSTTQVLKQTVSIARNIVFGRFLSGGFNTTQFIKGVFFLSISFFTLVFIFQYIYSPNLRNSLEFSIAQIMVIGAFVIINVVFDYVSVVQTRIFIDAALAKLTVPRFTFLMVGDVLTTLNLFILMYAGLLATAFLFFFMGTQKVTIVLPNAPDTYLSSEREPHLFYPEELKRVQEEGEIPGGLFFYYVENDDDVYEEEYFGVKHEGEWNYSLDLLRNHLQTYEDINVRKISLLEDHVDMSGASILYQLHQNNGTAIPTLKPLDEDQARHIAEVGARKYILELSVLEASWRSIAKAYNISFRFADSLEGSFPSSVVSTFDWLTFEKIALDLNYSIIRRPTEPKYCVSEIDSTEQFGSSSRLKFSFDSDCDVWVSTQEGNSMFGRLSRSKYLANLQLPYQTLFLTSILPTILFYFVIILLSVLAVTSILFGKLMANNLDLYLRAPLTFAGVIIGVIFAGVSLFL